jgi:zinc transport system substrate-binding protein
MLYVRTGVPFEDAWMERIRSANPRMQVLDAREGISLLAAADHSQDDEEHADDRHSGAPGADAGQADDVHDADPHVWVSPPLVRRMAGAIRDKLSELAPAYAAEFARNHDAFVVQLDALDRELRELLDPLPNRKFMVFHPAWGYFAHDYGLRQIPIEAEGKEPGAKSLARVIELGKREGVKVIFVQTQFSRRTAENVAAAIGARVVAVDPLAENYPQNLLRVAHEFADALK